MQKAWLVIGIVFFEGIYLLILKSYPQTCLSSFSCLGFYFVGSFMVMFFGAIVGLKLSKHRMLVISWFIKTASVITGVLIFEGFWFFLYMNFHQLLCLGDGWGCIGMFFFVSIIIISLGGILGFVLPKYFFHRDSKDLSAVSLDNKVKIAVFTFIGALLIIIADIVLINILHTLGTLFLFGFPSELGGFLLVVMIVIDLIVLYFLYKKIKDNFGAKVP